MASGKQLHNLIVNLICHHIWNCSERLFKNRIREAQCRHADYLIVRNHALQLHNATTDGFGRAPRADGNANCFELRNLRDEALLGIGEDCCNCLRQCLQELGASLNVVARCASELDSKFFHGFVISGKHQRPGIQVASMRWRVIESRVLNIHRCWSHPPLLRISILHIGARDLVHAHGQVSLGAAPTDNNKQRNARTLPVMRSSEHLAQPNSILIGVSK